MNKRPTYGGIPASAEASVARRRVEDAIASSPPLPAPAPKSALIETRLNAIEAKIDEILELLKAKPGKR